MRKSDSMMNFQGDAFRNLIYELHILKFNLENLQFFC